jgi:transcriptional regulator with XRE-family HTH domain
VWQYGDRLRELRAEQRMSLRDVEERGGPNKDTMSLAERGVHRPNAQTLGKIAQAFDMSVAELRGHLEREAFPKVGRPRSLRRFLMERVGHAWLVDKPLEDLDRVDGATYAMYLQEYAAFVTEVDTGKYPRDEREHVFDVPRRDVVLTWSTIETAHQAGSTVADAVELMRRDLVKEGFQPHDAQRDETA